MAELVIAFILMIVLLISMNHDRLAPLTGFFAGILVATYVIVEAPFSGFGMNPARTFASALPAWLWTSFWLYMIAPPWACSWPRNCMYGSRGLARSSAPSCTTTMPSDAFSTVAMRHGPDVSVRDTIQ